MRAISFVGNSRPISERLCLQEVPQPVLKEPHEILLKVLCNGICGTDIHILHGGHPSRPPVVLGHEVAAEVVEVGKEVPPTHLKKGDQVVLDPNIACPDIYPPSKKEAHRSEYCPFCSKGIEEQCEKMARGTTLGIFQNGGLAPFLIAPQGALYKVPPGLEPTRAVLAEPLSCIEHSVHQAGLRPGSTCLILGGGPMGALYAMKVHALGVKVFLNEVDSWRHGLAQKYLEKKENALQIPSQGNVESDVAVLKKALSPLLGHDLLDVVVDAVGVLADQAISLCRPGGTAVLLGMNQKSPPLQSRPYDIVRQGKKIVGSYIGKGFFPQALQTLKKGLPGLEHFTHGPVSLEKSLEEGFPALGYDPKSGKQIQAKSLKVLIKP